MKQYETYEFTWKADEPEGSFVDVDLQGTFRIRDGEPVTVKGFYAGNGTYKLRFLPENAGICQYVITGIIKESGQIMVEPADPEYHGIVRAKGCALYYEDGTMCQPFGTTIYAMMNQEDDLIDETIETLRHSSFNKVRLCVFPKHYEHNQNDPLYYAFQKKNGRWDPSHPDFTFWDRFETRLNQLFEIGIQVDLILFHPYDCWGFSKMTSKEDLTYLDYLLRRFSAYPNMWWSLANEYDLLASKTMEDWYAIEAFTADHDPYHHLLSCHQCVIPWDYSRPRITHISIQTSEVNRTAEFRDRFHKPVLIDECCYEGDLPEDWGSISGKEMTARFWRTFTSGGYCTHGETFLDPEHDIVFWAKGGKLKGESPQRIAYLKDIADQLPGPVEPLRTPLMSIINYSKEKIRHILPDIPEGMRPFISNLLKLTPEERTRWIYGQMRYACHCGEETFLWYYDIHCYGESVIELPEDHTYHVEVIDTWNMTRTTVRKQVSGKVKLSLPGKEYFAVLAVRDDQ